MGKRVLKLSNIASLFNGKTPSEEEQRSNGFPVLKIKDVSEYGEFIGFFDSFVELEFVDKHKDKIITKGDTLILNAAHNPAYVGSKIYFSENGVVGSMATGEWLIVRPNLDILDPLFIFFWLSSKNTKNLIKSCVRGIHLYPLTLAEIRIELPDLDQQKIIADKLHKANFIRKLRRKTIEYRESFLQSVFLEMFGDPIENTFRLKMEKLGEMIEINPKLPLKELNGKKVSFVPMASINENDATIKNPGERIYEDVKKGYTPFIENDVLFAKITPCMENGKSVIAKDLINSVGFGSTEFHVLRPNEKINPYWILHLVRLDEFRKQAAMSFTGTAGQQRVPQSFLIEYKIPFPPIDKQIKFESICKEFEKVKILFSESERQAEQLFQGLLKEAFD